MSKTRHLILQKKQVRKLTTLKRVQLKLVKTPKRRPLSLQIRQLIRLTILKKALPKPIKTQRIRLQISLTKPLIKPVI